jgi:hypothetical protein
VSYHCGSRRKHDVAIHTVLLHRESRNDIDGIAEADVCHARSNRIHEASGLVAEPRWKLCLLKILPTPPHRFGAIKAKRLYPDAHLAARGARGLCIDDFEDVRSACFVELNDA